MYSEKTNKIFAKYQNDFKPIKIENKSLRKTNEKLYDPH
jgi:hypothetical protein